MMIDIPKNSPWKQVNKGDMAGSIWKSRNIDLEHKDGSVRPSQKLIVRSDAGDVEISPTPTEDANNSFGSSVIGAMQGMFVEAPDGDTAFPVLVDSWTNYSATGVTSLSKEITVPAGTNRALLVIVWGWRTDSTGVDAPTSVTFNTSETFSGSASGSFGVGVNNLRRNTYYLPAPTETTANVTVNWADTDQANSLVQIFLVTGAKQTSTFGSNHFVSTTGATSLGFTADGDTLTGQDYELLLVSTYTQTATHSLDTGTEIFNAVVGSYRHSAYQATGIGPITIQGLPEGFARSQQTTGGLATTRWFSCVGTSVYETGDSNVKFKQDDSDTLPITDGLGSIDIKAFNSKLYLADADNLWRRSSTTWTLIDGSMTGDKPILCTYNGRLYIAGTDKVYSMNTSEVVAKSSTYTLDFGTLGGTTDDEVSISCMRAVSNGLWIGTVNRTGGNARMFFWDGVTANTVETSKEVGSGMVMAMSIKNDTPYILDNQARLNAFNGSYFEEVGRLAIQDRLLYNYNNWSSNNRWIHHNGMQTIHDEILMAINVRPDDTSDTSPSRTDAGIYAYNPEFGIYHKHSFTAQQDSTTIKDQGQLHIAQVGALFPLVDDDKNESIDEMSDFFVGYSYYSDASTEVPVIAKQDKRGLDMNADNRKEAGLIITTKITAEQVQETWSKFYTFVRPFRNSTDKIVVKYRKQEYTPNEMDITWVDTTSFTTTDSALATIKTNFDNGADYEVEGLQGDGAGYVSHITAITEDTGTYTVTLDETIDGVTTNTARVRIDRWTKFGEFTDDTESESFKEFNPGVVSTWIQFKIYMLGEDIQLERILSKSSITQES